MIKLSTLSFLLTLMVAANNVHAQASKIDTTASFADAGYRVSCNNKSADINIVSVTPKSFKKDATDISFGIRGRLRKIIVDDFNDDGYPDLVLCIYGGANGQMGTVSGVHSVENTSMEGIGFPDIYADTKLSEGYKGFDEFTAMLGTLQRTFPVFKPGDTDTATGGKRVIQYKLTRNENGLFAFKVLRSYDKP